MKSSRFCAARRAARGIVNRPIYRIRKNFIEETYEAIEAIDNDDPDGMREEFGDVILQVMLHSQMEEETGAFTVYDVIQTLNEKLIFRHPHVFGDHRAE